MKRNLCLSLCMVPIYMRFLTYLRLYVYRKNANMIQIWAPYSNIDTQNLELVISAYGKYTQSFRGPSKIKPNIRSNRSSSTQFVMRWGDLKISPPFTWSDFCMHHMKKFWHGNVKWKYVLIMTPYDVVKSFVLLKKNR